MKTFIFLLMFAPTLAPSDWLPCLYSPVPEQLHNWHITCEVHTNDNMKPYVHHDYNTIHQHGYCQEA